MMDYGSMSKKKSRSAKGQALLSMMKNKTHSEQSMPSLTIILGRAREREEMDYPETKHGTGYAAMMKDMKK